MLDNNVMDYVAVETEGYTTSRERAADLGTLFIGTRVETLGGDPLLAHVMKTSLPQDVTMEGETAFTKSQAMLQIKWGVPDPAVTETSAVDYNDLLAKELIAQFNYLFGQTLDANVIAAVTTAPFFRICGKES